MRAIGVTEFGGPENLQVLDVPEPHAGPGEVRIRVHAAAVNPTDSGLRAGRYAARHTGQPGPFIPGADAAGVVDEVGEGSRWSVGDRVAAVVVPFRPAGGAYADQVVVPEDVGAAAARRRRLQRRLDLRDERAHRAAGPRRPRADAPGRPWP